MHDQPDGHGPDSQRLKLLREMAGTRAYKKDGDVCNLEEKLVIRQEGHQQLVRFFLPGTVPPDMEQLDESKRIRR